MGVLAEEQRENVDALQGAVLDVLYRAMDEQGCFVPHIRPHKLPNSKPDQISN
jgi:hypothetical protein